MPGKEGSFWATTSGLTTGIAGTLTGVLGIAALATQAGWIGGAEDKAEPASSTSGSTTAPGGSTSTTIGSRSSTTYRPGAAATGSTSDGAGADQDGEEGTSQAGSTEGRPVYTVSPSAVNFTTLGSRSTDVVLRNTGDVDLNVLDVSVDGDAGRFTVSASACTESNLEPGGTCEIDVAFTQGGSAEATMVVDVKDAADKTVPLSGEALL